MSLSIIITCYNEVPSIFESYRTLAALMKVTYIDHEFIIVDDGSRREVQRALQDFFHEPVAQLVLSQNNEGHGEAVTKGIKLASKEYVCFIDTDLEIPAHTVPVLYYTGRILLADMVIAERLYRWDLNPKHLIRNLGSLGIRHAAARMLGLGRLDIETGAKLFRRHAVLDLLDNVSDTRWFWDAAIVAEALKRSQQVVQVPIVVTRRSDKKSSVHPVKDIIDYVKAIYAYKQRERDKGHTTER